jgi:hypothetical protein
VFGFGAFGLKPPQHILPLVPLLLAVTVASKLALRQSFPYLSRLFVEAGFANNTFGHAMILRDTEARCQLGR